jgi:putative transposase
MKLPVTTLLGLALIPQHRSSASAWLRRAGVPVHHDVGNGGKFEYVNLADLPSDLRAAWEVRQIEEAGLPAGDYDEAAHARFAEATPAMQALALRKAAVARFLLLSGAGDGRGITVSLADAAQAKFGAEGTDRMTLRRILRAVAGVDPVNFAPALLPAYSRSGAARAEISPEAWAFFLTTVRDAAPHFPLKQAWRDVRDVARKRGWAWPAYPTAWRAWDAMPEVDRVALRYGNEAAVKRLAMPIKRDKTTIQPLDLVSLDGRTLDFWVDFGDGKAVRPVMLALVDVSSNCIIGYELVKSENAVATSRLIRNTCQTHGIFDRLYTDNGSAFAGHLVAGGSTYKWRGKASAKPGVKPLGVCYHLGIDITFAIPKNAQAKIVERTFATLSRVIDDRPEFKGAHAGHAPGAAPDRNVVPVSLSIAEAVIRREVQRHNREAGRRAQGACGRSYEEVFHHGLALRGQTRPVRKPTAAQLYHASLIYTPASVDRWGRVTVDTWTYGGPETQDALLRWHGKGQILIGRDPDNFKAPAVAFDENGRLICRNIEPVEAGVYDSVEGAVQAAKYRKAARATVARANEAIDFLSDAELAAALADLGGDTPEDTPAPAKVVGARFGSPLQPKRQAIPKADAALTPEMQENLDRAIGYDPARFVRK